MSETSWDNPQQQVLRYAADLATLYEEVEHVRGNLHALRQRLFGIARAGLQLVACLSVEQVSDRLLSLVGELLGCSKAAVYTVQGGRLRLVSCTPPGAFRSVAPLPARRLTTVEPGSGIEAEWLEANQSDLVRVIPMVGRQREIGLCACFDLDDEGLTAAEQRALLDLLGSYGGITLENLNVDSRRSTDGGAASGSGVDSFAELLGDAPSTQATLKALRRLETLDATVLLEGETGTGKSLLAQTLHSRGPRAGKPFVVVNCSAIPESLVESELFGHEAGAFTGANRLHRGKVEQAAGGTLFLDEIAELPHHSQAKLLTFLETKSFTRVGGERQLDVDVRIVAATNRSLEKCAEEGSFRSDLFYRLNVFALELPPLRERGEDTLRLAQRFTDEVAARYGLPRPELSGEVRSRLRAYPWPGNIRELRNVLEKAIVLSEPGELDPRLLPGEGQSPLGASVTSDPGHAEPDLGPIGEESFADAKARIVERWERAFVTAILRSTGGNLTRAAERASMDKKYLRQKVKRLEIDLESIRDAPAE
ncbi:MAG: sigma-54-dependent Fis family transcriptional regulator [Planctomycetota bacterium]